MLRRSSRPFLLPSLEGLKAYSLCSTPFLPSRGLLVTHRGYSYSGWCLTLWHSSHNIRKSSTSQNNLLANRGRSSHELRAPHWVIWSAAIPALLYQPEQRAHWNSHLRRLFALWFGLRCSSHISRTAGGHRWDIRRRPDLRKLQKLASVHSPPALVLGTRSVLGLRVVFRTLGFLAFAASIRSSVRAGKPKVLIRPTP